MDRKTVYKIIDTEREYQENLGADRTDFEERTVGDYVTMLQHYQANLVEAWTMNPGYEEALEVMRKIAGIAVHCMEDWGAVPRKGYDLPKDPDCPCCGHPNCEVGHDIVKKSTGKKPLLKSFMDEVDTSWPFPANPVNTKKKKTTKKNSR